MGSGQSGQVIPNSDLSMTGRSSSSSGSGSGSGTIINLTVNAGMGTDPYEMGRIIVDSVKKYERVSGNVWTPAA